MLPAEVLDDILRALPRDALDAVQISSHQLRCIVEQRLATVCLRSLRAASVWISTEYYDSGWNYIDRCRWSAVIIARNGSASYFRGDTKGAGICAMACLRSAYVPSLYIDQAGFGVSKALLVAMREIGPTLFVSTLILNADLRGVGAKGPPVL